MSAIKFDSRGKAMCMGGRYRMAQQARFLRRSGGGNVAARIAISNAKAAAAASAS